jgi:hypothetical protein
MSQGFFQGKSNGNKVINEQRFNKVMTEQQFNEVVEAILAGKYSWACVLILRAAGYNPLHYIPYRTYNRLIKDNCCPKRESHQQEQAPQDRELSRPQQLQTHNIGDLSYLEKINKNESKITGSCKMQYFWGELIVNTL